MLKPPTDGANVLKEARLLTDLSVVLLRMVLSPVGLHQLCFLHVESISADYSLTRLRNLRAAPPPQGRSPPSLLQSPNGTSWSGGLWTSRLSSAGCHPHLVRWQTGRSPVWKINPNSVMNCNCNAENTVIINNLEDVLSLLFLLLIICIIYMCMSSCRPSVHKHLSQSWSRHYKGKVWIPWCNRCRQICKRLRIVAHQIFKNNLAKRQPPFGKPRPP